MYEKLPLEERESAARSSHRPQHTPWHRRVVAIVLVLILVLFSPWAPSLKAATGLRSCKAEKANHGVKYAGESLSWEKIGEIEGRTLEQSRLNVPMDQFNATRSGNKTFDLHLIRLRGKDGSDNLLLNPGGPGGSGFEFVYRRGKQLSEIVGDGYHLLSFDPRGINGSTPEALCYPSGEARQQLSPHRDEELIHDSPETFAWTQNYVKACAETMDEHGAYINTPQTAADMNSILDAVGQQDMAYWGFSYGTVLGQTYAGLFPERSRRVIIDGVVNNFVWYGNWFDGEQFANTEDVLDGFFDECIKAGRNCSLSSQADTKEELHDLVFGLLDDLKEQPISVYLNNSNYGLLDYSSLMYGGIFPALYKPASWYSLAENIAKLINGNATDAWLAYAQNGGFGIEGDGNSFVTHNDGLTGAMSGLPMDRKTLLKEIIPLANDSLFSPTEYGDYYIRQQWGIPRTHNFTQKQSVRTAHPLLVLSTSYDPICPLISAKSAYRAFQGSALIEVKGYGHCSVAVASTCLAKHVREFLYNGTLPDGHVTCDVDGSYFVKPEADGKMIAQMSFEDTEDEKIHLAQLELARDWDWRV